MTIMDIGGGRAWRISGAVALMSAIIVAGCASAQTEAGREIEVSAAAASPPAVSPAVMDLRRAFLDPSVNALTFHSMDRIFPTRRASTGGKPWSLPRSDRALDFTYELEGVTYTPQEFMDRTYTNALLVIKDGGIVYETYRNNTREDDRFIGFSMTKSITSILVGCAIDREMIRSLNDPIDLHLPELKGGAYEGVTIEQILQMRSGIDRKEDYSNLRDRGLLEPGSPDASMQDNIARYADAARTVPRARAPGSEFDYMNLDTAVLGWLVERVSGHTIAAFTSKCLWEPIGAEADGYFIMDGEPGYGREFNAAGFNATLRDWARVGLMMLNDGYANGRQVVSKDWVERSTRQLGTDTSRGWGYAYQWWTLPDSDAYAARGRAGQYIFIQPSTKTVIVKLSYYPPSASGEDGEALQQEVTAFFRAASQWSPHEAKD